MKNLIIVIIILFNCTFSFSQIYGFKKIDTLKPFVMFEHKSFDKFVLGFEHEFIYLMYKNQTTYKKERATVQRFEPHFSYYPIKNFGVGLTGKIEFFKSNYLPNNTPNVYELGAFIRYGLPFKLNIKFLDRFSFAVGASFSKTNYSRRDNDIYFFGTDSSYTMYNKMQQSLLRVNASMQFRIVKGLNFKFTYRYEMFIGSYSKFRPTLGIEYHFYEKKKNIKVK